MLKDDVTRFIELRRAMGFKYTDEAYLLYSFCPMPRVGVSGLSARRPCWTGQW